MNQYGNLQEVEIMSDMEHPNIIRMIASFTGMDFGQHQPQALIENPPATKMSTIEHSNGGQYHPSRASRAGGSNQLQH